MPTSHFTATAASITGPALAAALTPLALLPDAYGGVLWGALNLGLLFAALRDFFRQVLAPLRGTVPISVAWMPQKWDCPLRTRSLREGQFLLLALAVSIRGTWTGQMNALVLAAVLFALVQAVQGRWWAATLLLAVAGHLKVWALVAAALTALRWPRQVLPRLALCLPAVGLLPLAAKPAAQVLMSYAQWCDCLIERFVGARRWVGYRDAWTIWENLAPPVRPQLYAAMQVASGLAAAWCVWQTRRGVSARGYVLAVAAAWACWQLLLGPGTERLTYLIVAPVAAWAVLESLAAGRYRGLALAAWLLDTGAVESALSRLDRPLALITMPAGIILTIAWLLLDRAVRDIR